MGSESVASTIRLAMRRHTQSRPADGMARPKQAPASSTGWIARIVRWRRIAWWNLSRRLRISSRKGPERIAALSHRQSSIDSDVQRLETAFRELCANVDTLHARIHELEARERGAVITRGGAALNLSTKGQVIKLSRNGQSVRTIAGTLGLPVGEVEFVLKVQRFLNPPAGRPPQPAGEGVARPETATASARRPGKPSQAELREAACEPARVQ